MRKRPISVCFVVIFIFGIYGYAQTALVAEPKSGETDSEKDDSKESITVLVKVTDYAFHGSTEYEYDSAGNMTKETCYVSRYLPFFISYHKLTRQVEYEYITITPQ